MTHPFTVDYKNFFELIKLENEEERDKQLIELIDTHLSKYFLDDDRLWFNRLCNNGLFNVILYCEKTIPEFSLYDHRFDVNHISNVSFIWSIESGNLELIKYFMDSTDFLLFKQGESLNKDIGNMLQYYKERKPYFNFDNYEVLMNFLSEKFPDSVEHIFDKACRENRNDKSTEVLKRFLVKNKDILTPFLLENENDRLTIYCMLNLINDSYDLAKFIRKEFNEYPLDASRVKVQLYWIKRDIKHFNWMVDNPDFSKLENTLFEGLFAEIFKSAFRSKSKKEDYEYFNTVVKTGLHKITQLEYGYAIIYNLTPLVKKYYKEFDLADFKELMDHNNTSTNFIKTQIAKKEYKELQRELKVNKSRFKQPKI